jgi:uncharacterized protein
MNKRLLLVFTKNPQLGKVKTRLAKSIGDKKALFIFQKLIEKTAQTIGAISVHKSLYYSEFIENGDPWDAQVSEKKIQNGDTLGERMGTAFEDGFEKGFEQIVIIGTDLWDLESSDIEQAFKALETNTVVIGPATDGGYYLLGLSQLMPEVFKNKHWGTASVLNDTMNDFKEREVALLKPKNDIDYYEDLRKFPELLNLLDQ